MDRYSNSPGVVCDGSGYCLANPPRSVSAELVASAVFVFINGSHQAGITFLYDIQKAQAPIAVFLGN
jgi:hypothetical protein